AGGGRVGLRGRPSAGVAFHRSVHRALTGREGVVAGTGMDGVSGRNSGRGGPDQARPLRFVRRGPPDVAAGEDGEGRRNRLAGSRSGAPRRRTCLVTCPGAGRTRRRPPGGEARRQDAPRAGGVVSVGRSATGPGAGGALARPYTVAFSRARFLIAAAARDRMGWRDPGAGPAGDEMGTGAVLGRPLAAGRTLVGGGGPGRSLPDRDFGGRRVVFRAGRKDVPGGCLRLRELREAADR